MLFYDALTCFASLIKSVKAGIFLEVLGQYYGGVRHDSLHRQGPL